METYSHAVGAEMTLEHCPLISCTNPEVSGLLLVSACQDQTTDQSEDHSEGAGTA